MRLLGPWIRQRVDFAVALVVGDAKPRIGISGLSNFMPMEGSTFTEIDQLPAFSRIDQDVACRPRLIPSRLVPSPLIKFGGDTGRKELPRENYRNRTGFQNSLGCNGFAS